MYYCCWFGLQNQTVSDTTSQLYFSENSLISGGPYAISEEMKDQNLQIQELQVYGSEFYSLARNTFQNIFLKENQSPDCLPYELLQIIADKSTNIGQKLKAFIPYSNDQQLLYFFLNLKKFKIYTLEDDQLNIKILKKDKKFEKLEYISHDSNYNFDLIIYNCCSQNERMFQLSQRFKIDSIPKNQVFIFDYCKENLNQIIGQIMKDQETYKEELMTVSIKGSNKYYLFFTGKLSSVKNLSRLQSIENILIKDIDQLQKDQLIQVKKGLKYLKKQDLTYQNIIQIIESIKKEMNDKQQSGYTLLNRFISKTNDNKIDDRNIIGKIFQNQQKPGLLKSISKFQNLTPSQENFSISQLNSYNRTQLQK